MITDFPVLFQDVPDKKDGDDDNDDLLLWCLFCSGDADEGPLIETPCAVRIPFTRC